MGAVRQHQSGGAGHGSRPSGVIPTSPAHEPGGHQSLGRVVFEVGCIERGAFDVLLPVLDYRELYFRPRNGSRCDIQPPIRLHS